MEESTSLLNVLWVEDNENLYQSFSMEAKRSPYYLKLMPYCCWMEAEKVLIDNYDDISAIILDAKCKFKKDDPDDTLLFLPNVLKRLGELSMLKKRTIPWFILSAGDGGDSGLVGRLDWTKRSRLDWDDWEKDYYSKNTDRPALFSRIPQIAVHSNATQIKTILYKDVFEALGNLKGIDTVSAKRILTDILSALHFNPNDIKPVLYYNQLRQLVEILFRACNKVGLIPDQCMPGGIVNLNQSSKYLAGKEAEIAGVRYGNDDERIAPIHIEKEIRAVLDLGNTNSHTTGLDEKDQQIIEEFFRTANSRYIIFSLALQICDIILWLKDYISNHNDKDENLKKCQAINVNKDNEETTTDELEEAKKKYYGQTYIPIKDEEGFWHCGECSVILSPTHSGTIIIDSVDFNTDKRTNIKYKYFAKYKVIQ